MMKLKNLSCNALIQEGNTLDKALSHAIGIIGMAARLPEAEDYLQFWENLKEGRESIREIPDSRARLDPFYNPLTQYARHGYIEGIDLFDPTFFKTLPTAAPYIDPAQRLLMEAVNDAMEDGGYDREQLADRPIGVFMADHQPEYYQYLTEQGLDTLAGNLPANLAGRIAYVNGFTGPALTIDTACSSALVALHVAIESIHKGDCEMAFVGGVTVRIDLPKVVPSDLGVMSPSGRCCSFSADADGTVGGEGVIALLLKPLRAALADGDVIHAVIKGSAINQDGSRSNGMTAPSPVAQKAVIQAAWRDAGIEPATIGYMEAHGSATKLGDPIEITGITDAFREFTNETGFCPLGAVKTNVGHLGNIAGLAGLVKTILCLKMKMIPPIVNFREPNPLIDFDHAPVYVNRTLQPWKINDSTPRRAGVSSFGLSGTNAHVIVEEAPTKERKLSNRYQLVTLSAPKERILQERMARLNSFLHTHSETPLADVAFTLLSGRKSYPTFRWAAAVRNQAELCMKLQSLPWSEEGSLGELSTVFLLPDYTEGDEVLLTELIEAGLPVQEMVQQCEQRLQQIMGSSARLEAYPRVKYFTFVYALAQLWLALGVKPQTVIGLGVGEAVSAVLTKRHALHEALEKVLAAEEQPEFKLDKLRQFLQQQLAKGRNLFLHMGPAHILADVVTELIQGCQGVYFFPSYERSVGDVPTGAFMETLAQLYRLGANLNWTAIVNGQRTALPTGSYDKRSYWFDLPKAQQLHGAVSHPEVTRSEEESALPELNLPDIPMRSEWNVEEIAEVLTVIWQERLGLEKIERNEDFIELGGDSIRGMLLMNDIHKYFHVTLDLAYLLQYGTIDALAQKIKDEMVIQGVRADIIGRATSPLPVSDGALQSMEQQIPQAEPVHRNHGIAYYELSPSQKNLWLVHQLEPEEIAYNEPMPLVLKGALNIDAFSQALQTMVDRHSALRTFFTMIDSVPLQGVYDHLAVKITYEDQSALESQIGLEELVHAEARKPFDLSMAPLLRAKLIRLQEEEYLFIFVVHHIIFDGWSILVFMREVCQLYDAYVRGLPNPLSPIVVEYHDFAQWQNRLLEQGGMAAAETYWLNKLAGDLPLLDLPTDYPRPAQKSYTGSSFHFQLPTDLSLEVKEFSKRAGTTLFATMLAFFETLLYKYTRQEEFVIGTPSANRPHETLWGLIGFFVNTFAVRQWVSGDENFASLVQRVKADLLESYGHKDYPFTTLVSQLNVKRDPGRSALFDVMYVFHNVGSIESEGEKIGGQYGGIAFEEVKRHELVSDYDIKWEWEEAATHFNGKIEYSTHLFSEETIRRMAGHMTMLIADVLRHPEKRLADLAMLTDEERRQILHELNATTAVFPAGQTIPALWAEQVAKAPEHVAVIDGERTLTYREFDQRSTQVAAHLRRKGVQPNTIVPIMVERSLEMIIGIYGILKAGGAYLPIDVNYPEERIRYIIEDAAAKLLLVHAPTLSRTKHLAVEAIDLDDLCSGRTSVYSKDLTVEAADLNSLCSERTSSNTKHMSFPYRDDLCVEQDLVTNQLAESSYCPELQPTDLAYVIYTSGSTGKPKGVMIEHRALINRLHWMQKAYPLTASDIILQKTPYTFDVSVWEIFWWGLYGSSVCLLPPGGEKEPATIVETVLKKHVTTMHFVPSMLHAFLEYLQVTPGAVAGMASVRQVFASGEALKKKTVEQFTATLGITHDTRLHNLYGPTEAAIDVSYFDCREMILGETVPIGRPIDNIKLYIVDEALNLLPVGIPGEICIAGVGLARGYLNRAELTKERFVLNPTVPGERMYRTGDLGRFRRDGQIEFLGRIDHQVKVRGYRIELGEIEAALLSHPVVRETVILAREDVNGMKELVGYVVLRDQAEVLNTHCNQTNEGDQVYNRVEVNNVQRTPITASTKIHNQTEVNDAQRDHVETANVYGTTFDLANMTNEFRQHLLKLLPEYMVPAHFIILEAVPLLLNGKVDRKALLSLDIIRKEPHERARHGIIPPRNDLEAKMAAIWAKILHVNEVGIQDNFFELGGDSIKAIQVAVEASKLGLQLQMNDIIRYQTIEQVCTQLAVAVTVEEPAIAKRVSTGYELIEGEAILTPIQHWFFAQHFEAPDHWNQSLFLELDRGCDLAVLEKAFHKLLEHHDTLRLIYHAKIETFFYHNRILRQGFNLTRHHLADLTSEEQDAKMAILGGTLKASIDLEGDRLIKACIFDLGVRGLRLLITIHHLVVDGVSWRILLDDLGQIYHDLLAGDQMHLPPKTTSYKEWAEALSSYANSSTLQDEIPYWEAILQGAAHLPVDIRDGEPTISTVHTLIGELNESETQALLVDAHGAFHTQINDILLTALATAVTEWAGCDTIQIDLESHGRQELFTDINVSRTVGWFTALYPVKIDYHGRTEIGERIKAVKENLRTIPQGGIGYGVLRYLTRQWGEEERQAQLVFNYLGQMDQDMPSEFLRLASEGSGRDLAGVNHHMCLMEVVSYISAGKFYVCWSYSRNRYHDETMQHLLTAFLSNLRMVIHYCTHGEHVGYTPSDFPLARLSQEALDQLSTEIASLLEGIE